MWAIGLRFLTGYCVATDTGNRDAAEWPPHPLRLFMALAAAHFETDGGDDQREALRWLERQQPPDVQASRAQPRAVVTTFVPVNDGNGFQSLSQNRSRQPRTYPTVRPVVDTIHYVFAGSIDAALRQPLQSLAAETSRLGHSSSLVQVWIEPEFAWADAPTLQRWQADPAGIGGRTMRKAFPGCVDQLEAWYNGAAIARHADLVQQIGAAKGKAKNQLRSVLKDEFGDAVPTSRRPDIRASAGYRLVKRSTTDGPRCNVFDDDLLVLTQFEGPVLGSETTLRVAKALRGKILSQFDQPSDIPEWLGGHAADGSPSKRPHLAILPLPYVGAAHADGHLLGVALAFPRDVTPRQRGEGLRRLFTNPQTGEDQPIELRLGNLGLVTLQTETRLTPPLALRAETWGKPSRHWTTVTPIVLDRFPKTSRDRDRSGWLAEVAEIIAEACTRIGLPEPAEVAVGHTAWLRGVPRSRPGGGFPPMPLKGTNGNRYMVHALLAFNQPVQGPLVIGSGRFQGYGFCKPYALPNAQRGGSQSEPTTKTPK